MSRILIWRQIVPGSDIDIFSKTDYQRVYDRTMALYKSGCPNWGNKLWFQGIYSEINSLGNKITIRTVESISQINDEYDLIIYPMANIFGIEYCTDFDAIVDSMKGIRIPVYVIACGVQAQDYDSLDSVTMKIGKSASRFIETIYKTGGQFALRGYFTKEFFNRLGFPDAIVTGCPSMYQLGRDFTVATDKIIHDKIKPIINGKLDGFERIMRAIPESEYFSQETYFASLYDPNYFRKRRLKENYRFWSDGGGVSWRTDKPRKVAYDYRYERLV